MTVEARAVTALPCPFCDGCKLDAGLDFASVRSLEKKHWVYCLTPECGASGPFGDTKREAIERWNRAARKGARP